MLSLIISLLDRVLDRLRGTSRADDGVGDVTADEIGRWPRTGGTINYR